MNETQGGVSPSGYTGSGYGFAQNRLAMNVPLPPAAQRPPAKGDVQHPQINPGGPEVPAQAILNPGGPEKPAPPLWQTVGHPQWHGTSMQEPPLGVLGITFGKTSSGWRAY